MPENIRVYSGRFNATRQHYGPDHPATVEAERDLHEAQLACHIRELVDSWPPLTGAQRARLAALLNAGGDAHA